MENLNTYTPIELLKLINDSKSEHENLKQEIINHTIEVDELEKIINGKLDKLKLIELRYIELIEELNNRENAI
jgi:hypothetical protein